MRTASYRNLIQSLYSTTESDRVNWQATANPDEFIVSFGRFFLSVAWPTEKGAIYFHLRDRKGSLIDSFEISAGEELWKTAQSLYSLARQKALRIDEIIEEIVSELDHRKVAG